MTKKALEAYMNQRTALAAFGVTGDEYTILRRCSMTLHSWAERECGNDYGCIERDEATGRPMWRSAHSGKAFPIRDMETGALRRAKAILASHGLTMYHQGDCRGAALYALRPSDLNPGDNIDSVYNRGIAIYG